MVRSTSSVRQGLPLGILVVAALMILFGLAELVTAFTHSFFGLTTSEAALSTAIGAALGACYFAGGLVLLTGRRWAAVLAVALLCVDVIGRIAMVVAGLYPLDSFRQTFAIVAGTTIAAFFAVYVGSRRKAFK
jgi:hypothetical protein